MPLFFEGIPFCPNVVQLSVESNQTIILVLVLVLLRFKSG